MKSRMLLWLFMVVPLCWFIGMLRPIKLKADTPYYSTFPIPEQGIPMTQSGMIGNLIATRQSTYVPNFAVTYYVQTLVNSKPTGIICTLNWMKVGETLSPTPPQCNYKTVQVSRGDLVSYKVEESMPLCNLDTGMDCVWQDWGKAGIVVAMDRWGVQ